MISGTTFQPRYGGPSLTLLDDGRIDVSGMGQITRAWGKNVNQWKDLISKAAAKWDVPEAWIAGVMLQESGGTQHALSPVGAVGLMQIMPSTPMQVYKEPISKEDLWKPEVNIDFGARLLATLAKKMNWNPVYVAASYNAGGVYPFSGSASSCTHDGLWHLRENCGYCEQVVRGINSAITAGYSGTGASDSSSDFSMPWPVKVLAGIALAAFPFAALIYMGYLKPPQFIRNVIPQRNPYQPTWKDYIRGEWWIDESGESMFADQDIGDVGHEAALIDGLIEYYQSQSEKEAEQYDNESKIAELEDMRDDDQGASGVYFQEHIPDEVGIKAAGSEQKWNDIEADARLAFAKYHGAIQVVGTNFLAYKINANTIEAMQKFIESQADFETIDDTETEIGVEQVSPRKYASVRVAEFLTIKNPRELWSLAT